MADGFFLGGLAKGLEGLGPFLQQRERLKVQQEEGKLRQKMLDLQIKKFENDVMEEDRQRKAVQDLAGIVTGGVQEPSIIGGPVQGPITETGQEPAAPPPFTSRPATQREIMGKLAAAQPKEFATGLMKSMMPGGGSEMQRGYASLEEAQVAAKAAGIPVRIEQSPWGFFIKQVNPVNVAANVYHETLARTGNQQAAMQAFTQALYAGGAGSSAGAVSGKAGQELGEPAAPFVGIQGQQPIAEQTLPPPPPLAQPARAQPAQGPYPSSGRPAAGGSQSQRALRQRQAIEREERPLDASTATQVSAIENLLGSTIPNIRRNYQVEFLGPIQGRDIPFEARRQIGGMIGMPVSGPEATFRTAIKDAGDQLLRARSGAQINEQEYQRLQSVLPKPTDEPQVFIAALDRFESELRSLLAHKRRTAAEPRGAGLERDVPPPPAGWR